MAGEIAGKCAIVTGAASGIGAALVERLVADGAVVFAVDRNAEALESLNGTSGVTAYTADITTEEANRAMVAAAVEAVGPIDLAFLNAGVLGRPREQHNDPYAVGDLNLDDYRKVSAVNTDAVIYGTVAVAPAMNRGGAIIVTASTAGLVGWTATPFYCATKHAVVGWVRAVAPSLGEQEVTINAICPGGVATALVGLTAEAAKDIPRILNPADVAEAAIVTATSGASGTAVSVIANRDPIVQTHDFNDVPGFP